MLRWAQRSCYARSPEPILDVYKFRGTTDAASLVVMHRWRWGVFADSLSPSNRPTITTSTSIHRRNRRVEEHLQLVRPISLSFARRSGQCGEDLTQVGMLGLIKASTSYKNGSSVPFEAFARPHIRGAILHYLRDRTALIRLPRRVEERAQQLCRKPIDQLDAREQLMVARYRNKTRWCELTDVAADSHQEQLVDLAEEDRQTQVLEALDDLPANERKAIVQVILQGTSLREVARESGVSAMTIQRRVKRGLGSLSIALRGAQLSD